MLFELTSNCFAHSTNSSDLLSLSKAVLRGCHGISVIEENAIHYVAWLKRQTQETKEEWSLALSATARSQAQSPSTRTTRVVHGAVPNFSSKPLEISPSEAARFSRLPFKIYVENDHADKNFLKAFTSTHQLKAIDKLESEGFIEFDHCGGITHIPTRLEHRVAQHPANKHFAVAVFDSDSLEPHTPSHDANLVKKCCLTNEVPSFPLARRSIENYIPIWALTTWVTTIVAKSKRKKLIKAKDALARLKEHQRDHFNMKTGLIGDGQRLSKSVWDDLKGADRIALENGFGNHVASLFDEDWVRDRVSQKDSGWKEINGVIVIILGLVR